MTDPRPNMVDEETAAPRPEFLPEPTLNTQTSLSPKENTSAGETKPPEPLSTVVGIGSQLGPYQLLDKLGEGGMGAVYKARHVKLGRLVALKVLPQHVLSRPDALARFEREMMAVGSLQHPNVVQAHDAGEIGGVHYLSMEYVEGQDLQELIKSKGPMSVVNACKAIRQAALGLAAAHKLGLVHRDIKPSNLFVTKQTGQIKILDMGLALLSQEDAPAALTSTGQCFGTPDYMAPEQWEDAHSCDARADLYALGCTLFLLLVGRTPYGGDEYRTVPRKMMGHVRDPIPDLKAARLAAVGWTPSSDRSSSSATSTLNDAKRTDEGVHPTSDIPDGLDAIYRKLMAKEPKDRFASADQLAEALAPFTRQSSPAKSSPHAPREESRTQIDSPKRSSSDAVPAPSDGSPAPAIVTRSVTATLGEALVDPLGATSTWQSDSIAAEPSQGRPVAPRQEARTQIDSPKRPNSNAAKAQPNASPAARHVSRSETATLRKRSSRGVPPRGPNRKWLLGAGGAAALVMLGVIIITITNKDGTKTRIEVPGDAKVEITTDNDRKMAAPGRPSDTLPNTKKTAEGGHPTNPTPSAPASDSIDFAAERQAAEWVLKVGGNLTLVDAEGNGIALDANQLPARPFAVRSTVDLGATQPIVDGDLQQLSACRRLGLVSINGDWLTGHGLVHFAQASQLNTLQIASSQLTDAGLASLRSLPQLKFLGVSSAPRLTNEALRHVGFLSGLHVLELDRLPGINDDGLKHLDALPQLNRLSVSWTEGITDRGLEPFCASHPQLRSVFISNQPNSTVRTLKVLTPLTDLTDVGVSANQLTAEGIDTLNRLTKLVNLSVTAPLNDDDALRIARLNQIKQVLFYRDDVRDITVAITKVGWQAIATMPQLENLHFWGYVAPAEFDDACLLSLAAATKLRGINIAQPPKLTPDGIAAFRKARPDVHLIIGGKDYPATKLASEVVIPKRTEVPPPIPVEPDKPAAGTAKTAIAKSSKSVPLAVKVPRVEIPAAPLAGKANKAISNRAMVSLPAPLPGLRGWSIEVGGHTGSISGLAYSPDGQSVATVGGNDDTVRLWKITEVANTPVLTLDRVFLGEDGSIQDVAWSPDGFTLATTSRVGHSVTLFDVPTGRLLKRITLTNGVGLSVAWSPDGQLIAAAHHHRMGLIDPIRGVTRFSQRSVPLTNGCWSPDGSQIASVDAAGGIKFWKPQTLEPTAEFDSAERGLQSAAWSPDGKWVATGGNEGVIKIWEAATKKRLHELRPELGAIFGLSWEPAAADTLPTKHAAWPRLACVGNTGKLVVWDAAKGDKLFDTPLASSSSKVAWSPDGTQIAVAPFNHLELRDSSTGKLITTTENFGCPHLANAAGNLSASGKELRIHQYSQLTVWDADAGSFVKRVENLPNGHSLASPTDEWLAVFDRNSPQGNLHLVDTATYQNHRALLGHGSTITAVNWSGDGKTLASSSKDQTVRLWDAVTGEQLKSIPHPNAVQSVVWSPDGKRLATCGNDDIIRIWLATTGAAAGEFPRLPSPCMPAPSGLAWSPDGKYLAIAGRDSATRVLDLKSGKLSDPILLLGTSVESVAWSGDSKQLLAGTYGQVGYRTLTARESVNLYGYGSPVQWHPDRRRFLTGLDGYSPLQGLDAKRNVKIGALYPHIVGGHHVCISADGHYRGSNGIEQHIVYVALTKDGHQQTYSPADFAKTFNWKNDPEKAELLGK